MSTRRTLILSFLISFIAIEAFFSGRLISERVQPPAGYANNPPAYQNCTYCHSGSPAMNDSTAFLLSIGPDTSHLVNFTSGVTTYIPNQVYYLRIKGTHVRPVYGFELTADDSSGSGVDIGNFTVLDPTNTSLVNTGSFGIYVGHHNATQNNQWTFQWTAPATNIGPITFYWAGNDANGIDTTPPIGDTIYLAKKTIHASPGAAINGLPDELGEVKIFPTLCSDNFQLEFTLTDNKNVAVQLISMNGQVTLQVINEPLIPGNYNRSINTSALASGIYLLKIQIGDDYIVKKIIKQ